jgi:GT2 family glycosyltransferase
LKKKLNTYKNVEIKFMKNRGYGSAINYARTFITTKYFFVFSPDIKLIDDKFIDIFKKEITNIKSFGALGPRFLNVKKKSHKQSNKNEKIGKIESISGAAMLFNKDTFDIIGGFDENIFLYFEETDFCKRAQKKGYKIFQINEAKTIHAKGIEFGVVQTKNFVEIENLKNLYSWHFIWSKFYFYKKHYGYTLAIIYFLPIMIRILYRIKLYKIKKNILKERRYKLRLNGLITSIKNQPSSVNIKKINNN